MTTAFGRGLRLDDGDLVVTQGRLREVEATANLSQALTLRVLTPFGSDPFNTGYGLDLEQAFTQANPVDVVRQLVQMNLVRTLGTDPRVRDVRSVEFEDDPGDGRLFTVRVVLDTVAGDPLTLLVDVTPPVPAAESRSGRVLRNRTSGERDANQPQVRDQTEPAFPNVTNTCESGEAEQP